AAVPADVHTWPSPTYSTPESMSTSGYLDARSAVYIQCVVARRPSSSPAAASTYAPEHNDARRAPRRWARRNAAHASSGGGTSDAAGQPGTMIVSAHASVSTPYGVSIVNPAPFVRKGGSSMAHTRRS